MELVTKRIPGFDVSGKLFGESFGDYFGDRLIIKRYECFEKLLMAGGHLRCGSALRTRSGYKVDEARTVAPPELLPQNVALSIPRWSNRLMT